MVRVDLRSGRFDETIRIEVFSFSIVCLPHRIRASSVSDPFRGTAGRFIGRVIE
jgi:hypothetical protein